VVQSFGMAIMIKKANGKKVLFNEDKVRESILRTGADEETVNQVLLKVTRVIKDSMSTSEIYNIVRNELKRRKSWVAARYNLREALGKLGPAGFNFEKYVASILTAYGYKTETPDTYEGACITHEIDVTAEKEGRTAFIEAKFRHNFKAAITIKDTMSTWARFLDLVDGSKIGQCPHFDEAWIVTNARFTDQSLQYGHCKNMVLIGWNHPKERSFSRMVDLNALYPITVVDDLTKKELQGFAKANIMLCKEVCEGKQKELASRVGITSERMKNIYGTCKSVVFAK